MCEVSPSGDRITADSQEKIENLAQVRTTIPKDLLKVINDSLGLFKPPDSEPPEKEVKHHIQLTERSCPIKRSPYPLSAQKIEAL